MADGAQDRVRVSSGSPYEPIMGFSRAVRHRDRVLVSGTAAVMADGGDPPADGYGQAKRCLEIIADALGQAGATMGDVVRTRIFLVRREDFDGVARAHGEVFSEIRPADTVVIVAGLVDPRWTVEIEAEAVVGDG